MFEEVVEKVKEVLEEGKYPVPHVVFVRNNSPEIVVDLVFNDPVTKQMIFTIAIPHMIRMHAPEACIFVLPSTMMRLDDAGNVAEEYEAVMVYLVDPIRTKATVLRIEDGSINIDDLPEDQVKSPLMDVIRESMMSVWEGII